MNMQNIVASTDPEEVRIHPHTSPGYDTIMQSTAFQPETPAGQRQKRKRTSPRDHAILESAYQLNSKPDKEARLNLVQKVDLGEKEVQIWFQNRRQNDRRKAKPLQPHELIPHFRNGVPLEATKQLPSPEGSQTKPIHPDATTSSLRQALHSPQNSSPLQKSSQSVSDAIATSQEPTLNTHALNTPPSSIDRDRKKHHNVALATSQDASTDAVITKKRSHEQMTGADSQAFTDDSSAKDAKSLRRTSSFMRLAVSADGSVKVRVNDETTPSPPKERPPPPLAHVNDRRSTTLTRAQSDVSTTFSFRDVGGAMKGAIGRSRDARTWEFYCDKSARSSLAARAEEAANGSAVGALGLMRSASQKRPKTLAPNRSKQNHPQHSGGRSRTKPNLTRTYSSMARLQGSDGPSEQDHSKQPKGVHERRSSGSDSDKENWMPGTRNATQHLRTGLPASQRGAPLQEHPATDMTRDRLPIPLPSAGDQENRPAAIGGKSKVDDLDCVQGLLSLSQGAWR